MSRTHYYYFRLKVSELEKIVKAHQVEFDLMINDTFSDDELLLHEKQLDTIAALFPQPIFSELTFDDFYASPALEDRQRSFFESCQSSLCLEYLPYFQENPFQVTYLLMLLERFDEVLIDQGGVSELEFKESYMGELRKHRSIDSILPVVVERVAPEKSSRPVYPIDFLVLDVYKELERVTNHNLLSSLIAQMEDQSEKLKKIFVVINGEKLGASEILKNSGLIPKDFEDNLERLKFFLRKIV
jgi:hypothetical protein